MQKDWKEQGHKNVLTKNTIEAMGWAYVSEHHTTISVELGVSTQFCIQLVYRPHFGT